MSIISVSATTLKQDESSCEFEVNAKTIQNCPAGKMTVVLLGKEIIVKYACIERNLRNEEEEQVKLGLLNRCFAEASRKRQILSFTGPGVPWQTSFMEQLYVIFDAPPGQVRTTSLSKDFLERFPFKELVENGKYLLVSHGERIETGSITLKVIEGRFEAINEQSTLNEKYRIDIFTPRQRYKSSDVFCHNAVYSIASGQLIEVHKVNSASHKSSVPPFGVSAYHGFLLAHVLVSLHELGWFDLVKLNIGSARSVENDAMMLRCRKNIWNDLLDFIAGAGIIQLTDDKSSYVVKKEAFDVLMAEIGYVKFIQQGYSAVLEETVSLARGEKKYWKDIKRNDSGVGEFLLTYQYNVEPAIFNAIRDLRCKKMAYLGCGGGKKLIAICKENPGLQAIGVEIDHLAVENARKNVLDAGLKDRIQIVQADLTEWVRQPHNDVDLVLFIMGMAHDFLQTKQKAYDVFFNMKKNLAQNAYMILEDINLREKEDPWAGMTINKGFELVHSLMGANLGTRDRYIEIFKHFGWKIEFVRGTGLPNAWVYVLKSNITNENRDSEMLEMEKALIL